MANPLEKKPDEPLVAKAEPPVVAQLIVELRPDGSHTIARGLAEDVAQGERVQIEAEGRSPLELALSLMQLYHTKRLTLSKIIEKYTVAPAKLLNLKKGTLDEGADRAPRRPV